MTEVPQLRIVRFDLYCKKCEHFKLEDWEDPCDECLSHPGNEDSRQPIFFKPKD